MMELTLRKYKAVKYIHKKAPSKMLAWVLNKPLLFEDSSNVLFSKKFFIVRLLKSVQSYYILLYVVATQVMFP